MPSTYVEKLFSDPKFLADYSNWLKDPITQEVFKAAKELSEPASLVRPEPNAALYMHGVYVGFNRMLSFLFNANKVLESTQDAQLEETYGQDQALDAMYPQLSSAKRRRKTEQKLVQAPTA